MSKKEFYILFFDLGIGKFRHDFDKNVNAIIDKLRLEYFKNCSFKISEHTLLIVTKENIIDNYPNLESWIDDIVCELSKNNFYIEQHDFTTYIFNPDEKKKKELIDNYNELKYYILNE